MQFKFNSITIGTSCLGLPYSKTLKYFDLLKCYFYYTFIWLVTLQTKGHFVTLRTKKVLKHLSLLLIDLPITRCPATSTNNPGAGTIRIQVLYTCGTRGFQNITLITIFSLLEKQLLNENFGWFFPKNLPVNNLFWRTCVVEFEKWSLNAPS